jgi:glyoxylase-like metal-dependent hydrolase (beta-lactamase superfamily II)
MKAFASQADLKPKKIEFKRLSRSCWAFTAEGDPNTGVIVGDNGVMVIDAQATPLMAREVIRRIRRVTSKPIRYVVLSHYHAVRVLGASQFKAEHIIASDATLALIRERGAQDMKSEIGRFPRLFRGAETIPGLTWPTLTFSGELRLMMGKLEVRVMHPGAGHTAGDTIAWVPSERVLFSGDLSSTRLASTPAMRTSRSGRKRWSACAPSSRVPWYPDEGPPSLRRLRARKRSSTRRTSSAACMPVRRAG